MSFDFYLIILLEIIRSVINFVRSIGNMKIYPNLSENTQMNTELIIASQSIAALATSIHLKHYLWSFAFCFQNSTIIKWIFNVQNLNIRSIYYPVLQRQTRPSVDAYRSCFEKCNYIPNKERGINAPPPW